MSEGVEEVDEASVLPKIEATCESTVKSLPASLICHFLLPDWNKDPSSRLFDSSGGKGVLYTTKSDLASLFSYAVPSCQVGSVRSRRLLCRQSIPLR